LTITHDDDIETEKSAKMSFFGGGVGNECQNFAHKFVFCYWS